MREILFYCAVLVAAIALNSVALLAVIFFM